MVSEQTHQGESLPVACLLTFAAGLLDIYSYMLRGHVFANAITGNMVLLGMNLAAGHWLNCGRYLFAISAYGAGILVANIIHEKIRLPWNLLVNGMISFICAMQVRAFQHVHGLPFVSTTCTGNLRKGTNALFSGLFHHNPEEIYKAKHYYLVILSFVFGAVIGAFAFRDVSPYAVFIIPIVFCVVLWMISVEKKLQQT